MDEGRKVLEQEVVEVHANGANGHGQHHANGIEPSVELVRGNGYKVAPVNGDGHHAGEPKGCSRYRQPATPSLFEGRSA